MNSMKRQKDMTLKDELPRSVGAQYAIGEEPKNSSRRNEEAEPKEKQCPVVDVSGGDMDQQTGSKLGKAYIKAVYCHPAYLTSMQSTSCEMPGWMEHKLEVSLPGEISITSDMQMTPPLWQKAKKN